MKENFKKNIDLKFREIKTVMSIFKILIEGYYGEIPKKIKIKLIEIYKMLFLSINNSNLSLQNLVKKNDVLENIKYNFLMHVNKKIRNPLAVLNGSIEILNQMKNSKDPQALKKIISRIIKANYSLKESIFEVLDFSKLEKHNVYVELSKINIYKLISNFLNKEKITNILEKKKIFVNIEKLSSNLHIISDYTYIKKILNILFNQSIPFINEGGNLDIKSSKTKIYTNINLNITDFDFKSSSMFSEKALDIPSEKSIKNCQSDHLELYIIKKLLKYHGGKISAKKNRNMLNIDLKFLSISNQYKT